MSVAQNLTITEEQQETTLTVHLEGQLDRLTSPELDRRLDDKRLAGLKKVVFDLEKLEYLSSAGLRVFLRVDKAMEDQGEMVITHVNSLIMEIFNVCGFTGIMNIQP